MLSVESLYFSLPLNIPLKGCCVSAEHEVFPRTHTVHRAYYRAPFQTHQNASCPPQCGTGLWKDDSLALDRWIRIDASPQPPRLGLTFIPCHKRQHGPSYNSPGDSTLSTQKRPPLLPDKLAPHVSLCLCLINSHSWSQWDLFLEG